MVSSFSFKSLRNSASSASIDFGKLSAISSSQEGKFGYFRTLLRAQMMETMGHVGSRGLKTGLVKVRGQPTALPSFATYYLDKALHSLIQNHRFHRLTFGSAPISAGTMHSKAIRPQNQPAGRCFLIAPRMQPSNLLRILPNLDFGQGDDGTKLFSR